MLARTYSVIKTPVFKPVCDYLYLEYIVRFDQNTFERPGYFVQHHPTQVHGRNY